MSLGALTLACVNSLVLLPLRLGSFCFVVRLWQGVGIICFLNSVSLFPVVSSQVCDPRGVTCCAALMVAGGE